MEFYELMEICMLIAFGFSWPVNVLKAYKVRTAKGKSLAFLLLIIGGYLCGITGKLLSPGYKWYVMFFYILNLIMVCADLAMYIRNRRLDMQQKKQPDEI